MDVVFMCYWGRPNDDVFETCINTLSKVSPKAHLQVHTDDRPVDLCRDYGIKWVRVPKEQVRGRRALCKIEQLVKVVSNMKKGDRLIVADVDMYYLDDPFKAFEKEFDMAVTTRFHQYRWPVNGGIFFFRINKHSRSFIDFYLMQCREPSWEPLLKFMKDIKRPYTPDWEIGQNFLCAAYFERGSKARALKLIDVGPEYNFCPNTDVFGIKKAREMIEQVYKQKAVKVLHLKSELKMCIYDGYMEDAITQRCISKWHWM
jgi:hypothetical protein